MTQGNIFLTWENLAFSLPLILVCTSYAYFKYVPLHIGLPILGLLILLYQIRRRIITHQEKKLETLDEDYVRELAGDDDTEEKKAEEAAKKQRKAQAKLQQRLAAEKKAQNKKQQQQQQDAKKDNSKKKSGKKKEAGVADDDDDDALMTFAKGSRSSKKNK